MNEWMPDNACRIYNKFNLTNKESIFSDAHLELRRIFASVNTELSSECWKDTGYLIYEVVVNAYYHGDAGASYIEIHPDMISVVDDGNIFDPKLLLQTDMGRMQGGKNTLKRFVESYPEIELFYQRNKEYNFFTINFGMNVFNINKMSRLSADNQAQHLKLKMRSNTVGEFKYYYFDIKQLNSGENDFASWLPISMQRCIIKQLTVDIPIYEKKSIVFIYFSEIDIEELSDLHTSFYLIAKDFNKKREDLEIKVIPELNFVL